MLTTAIVAMPLSVFAAEATACATWDEVVAAVTADTAASIKLTDHVTANSTIESFSGTFDGNGYTVTVEKTMFTALADGAVLKNFQTTAAAAISEAPIAVSATGTVTFTNVINNVSVSGTGIGQMGGFLTTTAGTTTVNMTSCVNNGNIQTNNQASGIIGNTEGTLTVNFTDVVNNGDITGNKNYAGGIVCSNGALAGTMNRVINNGDIYVESTVSGQKGSNAAGLIGTAKGMATVTLTECVNTGAVTLVTTNTSSHYGVAGFAIRTDDTSSVFTFDKCVNTGVLTSETAPANDAIAVPLKSGSATATGCTYSSGTSTVTGATQVDAATAEASIAAIEAKMTLPTFDANKAPETTTPGGEGESDTFKQVVNVGFATATIEGPSVLTVGETGVMTITFEGDVWQIGIGLSSSDESVANFTGTASAVFTPDHAHIFATPASETAYSFQANSSIADTYSKIVVSFNITATAAGTTTIEWIPGEEDQLYICSQNGTEHYHEELLGYNLTVVEESSDTPDEPADNSTTLDATTGTLTVTGPATAVAGESFDVTFTWSDYGFTPDAIDLEFYLNTITSQTQAGNIAVSAIKSTNFTSYSEDVFGYADNTNLFKIGLTDMTGVGDTVEIVVTFSSTTPGYTGFSLHYAALSNVTGTGYTEIANYDKTPDYEEAYVIELTVPETSHTVIFMDGDTTLNTSKNVAYGSLLADVYTAPAKEGYTFNGWKDASGASVTTVTGDITVYADYSVNEYTVNITVVNGTATNATQKLNYAGSIDATVNAALAAAGLAPDTGYTDSYTVSEPSVSGTTIAVTVTYTTKLTYTVKFVGYNGADLGSVTIEHGKAATAPTAPAVEGYTFTGWDKDFSNVTGALTVNAVYEINKYTVKFVGYNGADLGSVTVEHGAAATAPTAPAVEGYTFKNWDKAFDKVTGDLTVTAVYEINKYTVTFKGQDGATLKTETVEHGAAATAPTAPAVEGYTFSKWDKDFSKVTGNLTVNAVYTINSYNVTVTVKAEGDYAKTTANYNTEYTLPTEAEVRAKGLLTTNDIFSGWMINGESFDAGAKVTITADTVITAILSNVTYYTVTIFDDETTTNNSYAEGTTFTVPAAAGKTGYTFVNWTDDEGIVYTADQTVTVTADITLTANYKINTYTVKFVGFNGADLGSVTVEYGKAATAPTAPAVEGYTFNDWDTDFSSVTSDLTVTALYTINSYDIVITDHDGTVKTVKANYGENVLEVVNANYVKDASLEFVGFYNHNGTLISSTGKVTDRTLVYVAYTVENILAGGNDNIVIGDGIITYYAGADVDAFTYGTVAKNGGTGDTITFTAPLLVADAVADKISYTGDTATYTIIVMGDVDGDADVDTDDAALVADQMLDSTTLTAHFYTAANTTYPTALITARDIAAIKAFAKGTITAFAK